MRMTTSGGNGLGGPLSSAGITEQKSVRTLGPRMHWAMARDLERSFQAPAECIPSRATSTAFLTQSLQHGLKEGWFSDSWWRLLSPRAVQS